MYKTGATRDRIRDHTVADTAPRFRPPPSTAAPAAMADAAPRATAPSPPPPGAGRPAVPPNVQLRGLAISGGGHNIAAVAGALHAYITLMEERCNEHVAYPTISLCSASALMAPFLVDKPLGSERRGIEEFIETLQSHTRRLLRVACAGWAFACSALSSLRCPGSDSIYSAVDVHSIADVYTAKVRRHPVHTRHPRVLTVQCTDDMGRPSQIANVTTTVDMVTGDRVILDNTVHFVEGIKASSALVPLLPYVSINGRAYCDGGVTSILPHIVPHIIVPWDGITSAAPGSAAGKRAPGGDISSDLPPGYDMLQPTYKSWDVFITAQYAINTDDRKFFDINTPFGIVTNVARGVTMRILRDDIHTWFEDQQKYGLDVRVWCIPVPAEMANLNMMTLTVKDIERMFQHGQRYMHSMLTADSAGRPLVRHMTLSELVSLDRNGNPTLSGDINMRTGLGFNTMHDPPLFE